jgi:hypothetical protein
MQAITTIGLDIAKSGLTPLPCIPDKTDSR